jgi:hypothetical protein
MTADEVDGRLSLSNCMSNRWKIVEDDLDSLKVFKNFIRILFKKNNVSIKQ